MYKLKIHSLYLLYSLLLILFYNCTSSKPEDEVLKKVLAQLTKQNIVLDSIDKDSLLCIDLGENTLKISLHNLRIQYAQEKNDSVIINFVNNIARSNDEFPPWEIAKKSIYFSLFDSEFNFEETINNKFSKKLNQLYIYSTENGNSWILNSELKHWGITVDSLDKQALQNSAKLVDEADVVVDTIEGKKIAYFILEDETLKPSLLFAPNIKEKIKKHIGWPVIGIMPARDVCFYFNEKDLDFFAERIGENITKMHKESAYALSTEAFKISDKGISLIGVLAPNSN